MDVIPNMWNPLRGAQYVGNYGRYVKRKTRTSKWRVVTTWKRLYSLAYATYTQQHRMRHSKQHRREVFGDHSKL